MSKIFKCISLVLVLVMMMSVTTFAAGISTPAADADKDARTVEVSGTVADAVANQQVVILVLKSTANLQSVSDADIAYVDQIAADADGKFNFNFAIDESKGDKFTAYIGGTGVAAPQSASINLGKGGAGDCDESGKVDFDDYMIIINNYNKTSNFDVRADLDASGKVDFDDYMIVINNYNKVY